MHTTPLKIESEKSVIYACAIAKGDDGASSRTTSIIDTSAMSSKRGAERFQAQAGSSRGGSPALSRSDTSSSSKASSPTEPARSQVDFQFLNFSHPSDAKASRARRAVRSHVTRQQHQREQAAAASRRAQGSEDLPTPPDLTGSRSNSSSTSVSRSQQLELPVQSLSSHNSPESSSPSPSPAASPTDALDRINPARVYPAEWHPYIPRVLDHYYGQMTIDIPELDGPDDRGLLRSKLLPFAFTDLASMHAVMLVAATHFSKIRGSRSHAIDLLQLRGMAIRSVNDGLGDASRMISDQMIVAVAHMATFEVLFGDRQAYNTHMTGLLRIVSIRGGLPALGLDGFLERFLLWTDVNGAYLTGNKVHFDPTAFPSSVRHPRPDSRRFKAGLP